MNKQANFRHVAALFLMSGALACDDGSDQRTERLTPGMSRAEAVAVLQAGASSALSSDSVANIWQAARYLVDGREIEVIWYSRNNERRTAGDTVPEGKVFPIVLVDGRLVGAGRAVYDSIGAQFKFPKNKY
jgi:hypothetical protein